MNRLSKTKLKNSRWNRWLLRHLSPEQKRQRKIELQRDWQRRNKKKIRNWRKAWLRKFHKQFHAKNRLATDPKKPLFRNPLNERAVYLYQNGHTSLAIAKTLDISPGSVRAAVWRAGIKRKPVHRVRNHLQKESTITRLVVDDYRQEIKSLKCFDETLHWSEHPEYLAWQESRRAERHRKTTLKNQRKYYQARLAKFLDEFKCQFCGRDASAIPLKRRRLGIKYCSNKCNMKARMAAEKLRLQFDPQFWLRKSVARKKCYHLKRRERPEVYRAEVRRKLENPQYRIAKAHRTRIYLLVAEGKMIKTQTSLKYFGCTQAHLKRHLISQFKPGMTWENYGKIWEVDHRIPLDSFDLLNPTECAIAFNWQNLRPMFPVQNRMKSNKMTHPQQPLPLVIT